MSELNAELVAEIQTRAVDQCMELSLDLIASQQGVGDVNLSPPDRIARFVDYANRGILDILRDMGAPVYRELIREFVSDMERSPLMQPFPTQTTAGAPLTQLMSDIGQQMAGATNG